MTIFGMFPIIPPHLSYPPPTPRPAVPRRPPVLVVAAGDIPAHVRSPGVPLLSIIEAKLRRDKHEVGVSEQGLLEGRSGSGGGGWVRHLRLAPDCHSVNTVARLLPGQTAVSLTTVKSLQEGEELRLWFDPDTLAAASIPFLTPHNIQGEKNYICHKCGKHFEYPNPLKIHLALECGTLRKVELWKRLCKMEASVSVDKCSFTVKHLSNPLSSAIASHHHSISSSISTPTKINHHRTNAEDLETHSSKSETGRFSAFKPYLSLPISESNLESQSQFSISSQMNVPSNLIFSSPPLYPPQMTCRIAAPQFSSDASSLDQQQAEVETLVSNLGRSKQGHLCIYCGKLYSRKYGLKIHIRTHTGFKPLKCKFCLRPFGDPSNLNKHVRLHAEGETPYKCEECGKVLVRRRDLERHIKSRHLQEDCL